MLPRNNFLIYSLLLQEFNVMSPFFTQKALKKSCLLLKKKMDLLTTAQKKSRSMTGLKNRAGIVLLSHRVSPALPSPLEGLTSEFEMGSGVSPPLSTPTSLLLFRQLNRT